MSCRLHQSWHGMLVRTCFEGPVVSKEGCSEYTRFDMFRQSCCNFIRIPKNSNLSRIRHQCRISKRQPIVLPTCVDIAERRLLYGWVCGRRGGSRRSKLYIAIQRYHILINVALSVYTHAVYVRMYMCVHVYTSLSIHNINICVYIYVFIYVYVYMCIYPRPPAMF